MNDEALLTYEQAAALLNIKVATLYAKVSRHEVPFFRLGGRLVRFSPTRLREWLESRQVTPTDSSATTKRHTSNGREPRA
jgi:excisionase family DNA binding protein